MRRSAAPSQNVKRMKFESPFLSKSSPVETGRPSGVFRQKTVSQSSEKISKETIETNQDNVADRSTSDILKLLQAAPAVGDKIPKQAIETVIESSTENRNSDCNPKSSAVGKPASNEERENDNSEAADDGSRYFNVMWCKLSKKKHKKWEGDAVLIVKGRTAVLKNMEGKEIGRSMGYKIKEIESIDEGQMFVVGGKECEIQNEMQKKQYITGACFTKSDLENNKEPYETTKSSRITDKMFVPPLKDQSNTCKKPLTAFTCKLKYSVDNSNAIVLPCPSQMHQWKHNVNHLPLVDVVIDPQLAIRLRPHQQEGVVFLYECVMGMRDYTGRGAILADEMGLGKTLQSITLIWTLLKQGPYGGQPIIKRALVITPSSLIKNWLQEFHKWLGRDKISVYAVDQQNTVQKFTKIRSRQILLISYEMFVRNFNALETTAFDIVICDEGHRLKNSNIKTSNIITRLQTRRRVVLTGTPIQNDLGEFYSIVEFCNPGIFGSPAMFKNIYETPIVKSRQPAAPSEDITLGQSRAEELTRLTSMFVLRRTQDVINSYLPSKVENVVLCQVSPLQVAIYNCILQSRTVRSCLNPLITTDGACHLACITILKKLCNHPYLLYAQTNESLTDFGLDSKDALYSQIRSALPDSYKNFEKIPIETDSGKLSVLSNLLEALHSDGPKEKIVIVSGYKQTLDLLQDLCRRRCYSFLRLDGSTPTAQRQALVNTFNSPKSKHFIFLLSSKAGGLGLNLIGASRIVLYDIDWNPATDLQAMARIWRDGQCRQVHIYRLLTAGTIEEKIYQRQVIKQGLSGAVMDNNDLGKVKFSLDDLKDLFTFRENATSTTHDLLQCHCNGNFKACASNVNLPHDEQRTCQLGKQISLNSEKNATMATLMRWDHLSGINLTNFEDKYLDATDQITFIFRNKVNS